MRINLSNTTISMVGDEEENGSIQQKNNELERESRIRDQRKSVGDTRLKSGYTQKSCSVRLRPVLLTLTVK